MSQVFYRVESTSCCTCIHLRKSESHSRFLQLSGLWFVVCGLWLVSTTLTFWSWNSLKKMYQIYQQFLVVVETLVLILTSQYLVFILYNQTLLLLKPNTGNINARCDTKASLWLRGSITM